MDEVDSKGSRGETELDREMMERLKLIIADAVRSAVSESESESESDYDGVGFWPRLYSYLESADINGKSFHLEMLHFLISQLVYLVQHKCRIEDYLFSSFKYLLEKKISKELLPFCSSCIELLSEAQMLCQRDIQEEDDDGEEDDDDGEEDGDDNQIAFDNLHYITWVLFTLKKNNNIPIMDLGYVISVMTRYFDHCINEYDEIPNEVLSALSEMIDTIISQHSDLLPMVARCFLRAVEQENEHNSTTTAFEGVWLDPPAPSPVALLKLLPYLASNEEKKSVVLYLLHANSEHFPEGFSSEFLGTEGVRELVLQIARQALSDALDKLNRTNTAGGSKFLHKEMRLLQLIANLTSEPEVIEGMARLLETSLLYRKEIFSANKPPLVLPWEKLGKTKITELVNSLLGSLPTSETVSELYKPSLRTESLKGA